MIEKIVSRLIYSQKTSITDIAWVLIRLWFLKTLLKVGLSPPKKMCVICLIGSPLKMMKNAIHFFLKSFFVLKIFKFLSWHIGYVGKTAWLIRKLRLVSKFVTSQPGLQAISIWILPNISQTKGNQTIKFGQVIEHNKIFFFKNCVENKAG